MDYLENLNFVLRKSSVNQWEDLCDILSLKKHDQ